MATIRENLTRFNFGLLDTLGLIREVNRREPVVRFTSNVEQNLDEELSATRLITNEE